MKKSFIKKLLIVFSLTVGVSFAAGLLNPITAKADGQGILEEVQLLDFYGNPVGSPFTIPVVSCTRDPNANDYTVVYQKSITRNGVTYTLGGLEDVNGGGCVVLSSSMPDGSIIDAAGAVVGDPSAPVGYVAPAPANLQPPAGGSASSGGSGSRSSGGTGTRTSGGTSSRTSGGTSSRTSGSTSTRTSTSSAPKSAPTATSAPSANAPAPAQASSAPSASTVNAIASQLMANAGVPTQTASHRMLPTFVLTVEYLYNGQRIADNDVVLTGLGRVVTVKAKDIPGYVPEYKTVTVLSSNQNMAQNISFKYVKKSDKKAVASIFIGSNLFYHNRKIIIILVFAVGAALIIFIIRTIKK